MTEKCSSEALCYPPDSFQVYSQRTSIRFIEIQEVPAPGDFAAVFFSVEIAIQDGFHHVGVVFISDVVDVVSLYVPEVFRTSSACSGMPH